MKFFFNALLNFMVGVANIFLTPVNTIITTYFPSVSSLITSFTSVVNTYVGGGLAYFFAILPPNTRNLVLIYVTLLIAFYTISLAAHAIIKVIEIIKSVKIW